MAVSIRLTRQGRKHLPFYRIGVFHSRTRRDGRPIEYIGFYNPESQKEPIRLDVERAKHWLGVGAQPSETLESLLVGQGLSRELWQKGREKPGKPKVSKGQKNAAAEKERKVKRGRKPRKSNSKDRAAKKAKK